MKAFDGHTLLAILLYILSNCFHKSRQIFVKNNSISDNMSLYARANLQSQFK